MAWASGTATDFVDFLRLLRDYAAGLIDPATHPTITSGGAVTTATAVGTLTFTGNAADTETITIGPLGNQRTYTFQTTLTNVDGNVHIGATSADTITNLIEAMTLGSGSGTDYAAAMTANYWVTASAGAGTSVTLTANSGGQFGNAVATVSGIANATFGAATLTGGVGWYILPLGPSMTALPGSGYATDGEFYLAGPGSDPEDQIIIGAQSYRNAGANIFGFALRGYTGWNSALTFTTLAGTSQSCNVALDDASIACWFWVADRRLMALARIGTTDILCHAGFIQQFGTRSQYPYPLLIAGSVADQTISYQSNLFSHSCMPDPAMTSAYLRWVDGTWHNYANYSSDAATRSAARIATGNCIWPQRNPVTPAETPSFTNQNEDTIFEAFLTATAPVISSTEIGAYPIFPAVLINGTAPALVGRVDGLFACFGLGLNSGDTLTLGGDTYDVFSNTWRSEPVDKIAILRA